MAIELPSFFKFIINAMYELLFENPLTFFFGLQK
jgi:hypothetical protein